jgi:hypothetical protein
VEGCFLKILSVAQTMQYKALGCLANIELERILKELVAAYFGVLSRHFPEGTEADHGKPRSGQSVSVSEIRRSHISNVRQKRYPVSQLPRSVS